MQYLSKCNTMFVQTTKTPKQRKQIRDDLQTASVWLTSGLLTFKSRMTSRTISKGSVADSRQAYVQIRVPPEMPCLHPTMSVSLIKNHVAEGQFSCLPLLVRTEATHEQLKPLSVCLVCGLSRKLQYQCEQMQDLC